MMGNVAGETGGVRPGEAVHVQWVSEPRRRDVTFPPPTPKQEAFSGQPGLSPTASTVSVLVLGIWVSSLDRVSLGR